MENLKNVSYSLVKNGGHSLDRRTCEAKKLIVRIQSQAAADMDKFEYNPAYYMLRINDVKKLFTLSNLNLN